MGMEVFFTNFIKKFFIFILFIYLFSLFLSLRWVLVAACGIFDEAYRIFFVAVLRLLCSCGMQIFSL